MQLVRIIFISLLSLLMMSCAWIGRDYYFNGSENAVEWQKEFYKGRGSDKNGVHPDTVAFTYIAEKVSIKINVAYQDVTVFGPIIVPVIPLPWQHTGNLYIELSVEARDTINFDVNDWRLTDLDTNHEHRPEWINVVMPATLEGKIVKEIVIRFPVKAAEISHLKLDFGSFIWGTGRVMPPPLSLRKSKGDWHYNMFTL